MSLRFKQLILLAGDLSALFVGLYLAVALRFWSWSAPSFAELTRPFFGLFIFAALVFFILGLYDVGRARNTLTFHRKIVFASLIWLAGGVLFFYVNPHSALSPKTILLLTAAFGFSAVSLWRFLYNQFLSTTIWQTRVMFIGITPEVVELIALFKTQPERGLLALGCVGETLQLATLPLPKEEFVPTAPTLEELLNREPRQWPDLVVLSPAAAESELLHQEVYRLLFKQVGIVELATFYETIFRRVPPFTFSEGWFITHLAEQQKKIYDRFRLLLDYALTVLMTIVLAATFPIVAILIKLTSPGPVLFKQARVGRNGKTFSMYKYRTMQALSPDGSAELAGPEWAKKNDTRITPFGKFLRLTRLDELPQALNIWRGDMGLIGPRPERPEFVETLTKEMPFYALRHLIKPGLTGWAQLQHSYYGNIGENLRKLEYDLYYVKNRGPLLDLAIILRTFNVLFGLKGR